MITVLFRELIRKGRDMKKISIFIQLVLIMFVISAIPAISVIYVNSINMRKSSEEAVADSVQTERLVMKC